MANEIVETKAIEQVSDSLYKGVSDIIDNARQEVVVYVNKHSDLMFWHIGHYINEDMGYKQYSAYGSKILATLSQTLTWSHFLELVTIEDNNKRLFYQQMGIAGHRSVRQLRDKQGNSFPFLSRRSIFLRPVLALDTGGHFIDRYKK